MHVVTVPGQAPLTADVAGVRAAQLATVWGSPRQGAGLHAVTTVRAGTAGGCGAGKHEQVWAGMHAQSTQHMPSPVASLLSHH